MAGNFNLTLLGALLPTVGGSATGFGGGGGVCHEEKALPHCTFAKGFDSSNPPPVPSAPSPPLAPLDLVSLAGHEGSDTFPRPALRSAILVPSLLSMALDVELSGAEEIATKVDGGWGKARTWGK